MLAMILALMAATSCFGRLELLESSCASICAAVRMCVARAEKSGWSAACVFPLVPKVERRGSGLFDLLISMSEVRGVDMVVRDDIVFAPLEERGMGGFVDIAGPGNGVRG